jgi:isopenicillin-N epimerase
MAIATGTTASPLHDQRATAITENCRRRFSRICGRSGAGSGVCGKCHRWVNAIVRSLRFSPGDQIVITNHTYGAVRKTLEFVGDRSGANLIEAIVPFPIEQPQQVVEAIEAVISPHTKLLVVDHITSATALIFPVIELVKLARETTDPDFD